MTLFPPIDFVFSFLYDPKLSSTNHDDQCTEVEMENKKRASGQRHTRGVKREDEENEREKE